MGISMQVNALSLGNCWNFLKNQYTMPWIVFGDFNEITESDEKIGWLDRDAKQMAEFRDCLNRCELFDLGFIGQKFTWCNWPGGGGGVAHKD